MKPEEKEEEIDNYTTSLVNEVIIILSIQFEKQCIYVVFSFWL